MRGDAFSYLLGLIGVAVVAAITTTWLPVLGTASSVLLFLLPVLMVAARGGVGPALTTAAFGALAYNFFLLPPRFTFRIHGFDNLVSVFVLFAVALVTSRLATALQAREAEASHRAAANAEVAQFSALLGRGEAQEAVAAALDWLAAEYGEARIIPLDSLPEEGNGFSTLDLSAAAWAMHNGDITGHGSAVMPAADWTFLPLSPRTQSATDLLAIARPANGNTRDESGVMQLQALARLLGQARDRIRLDEERQARERLEDRDTFRRTLLASLAHDFRTPLTVVMGELAKLAAEDTGASNALAEAKRLDRMMDDLVGAARIEAGALTPHIEAVDLVDAVTDAVASLGDLSHNIRLAQDVGADLPLVEADPVLLRHILTNLIDNAARHAKSTVAINANEREDAVTLAVEDDGPGIPEAECARIFERFTRIEGDDRGGGSGLGLAIVKGFADAMDMGISVEANKDGGARFHLVMPARRVSTS
ncbi:MAG: ATP-binding protein [Sphingobium sp.]